MANRSRMSRRKSSKDFRRKSDAHPLNSAAPYGTMRGGIRL